MRLEISELHQTLGKTMIYVTHDQVEAMTMADKIVVLNAGNIEQVGSPLELYRSPKNLFVAGFIGSPKMNMVEGAEAAKHGAKTIGVRPEHISVSTTPVEGAWKGTVGVAEHLGPDTFIHVAHRASAPSTSAPTARSRSHHGDTVYLTPNPERIHRFDAQRTRDLNQPRRFCDGRSPFAQGAVRASRRRWPAPPMPAPTCRRGSSTSASATSTARTCRSISTG